MTVTTLRSGLGWAQAVALAALVAFLTSGDWAVPGPSAAGAPATDPAERRLPTPESARASEPALPAGVGRSPASPPPAKEVEPPVRVLVDGSGIDADVVPVGVADDGQMELPPNPDVVGWYRHGPGIGSGSGSVVLGGHVDSIEHGLGQLARLRETNVGEEVVVETAAEKSARYAVTSVASVPKEDLPLTDIFRHDGGEQLVLITCGGEFDPSRGTYRENIVVTAVPR